MKNLFSIFKKHQSEPSRVETGDMFHRAALQRAKLREEIATTNGGITELTQKYQEYCRSFGNDYVAAALSNLKVKKIELLATYYSLPVDE